MSFENRSYDTTRNVQWLVSKSLKLSSNQPNILEKIAMLFQYLDNVKENFPASNVIKSIFKCSMNIKVAAVNVTGDAQIAILKKCLTLCKPGKYYGKNCANISISGEY